MAHYETTTENKEALSIGERVATLEAEVRQLRGILVDNGQPGLDTRFTEFAAEWRGREKERKDQERKRAVRDSWFQWAVGTLIAAILLWIATLELRHKISENVIASTQYSAER